MLLYQFDLNSVGYSVTCEDDCEWWTGKDVEASK